MTDQKDTQAGWEQSSRPAFVLAGKLGKTHGIKGEIQMQIHTDFPERMRRGRKVYIGGDKNLMELESVRPKAAVLLLKFVGIDSPEDARRLTNKEIFVAVKDLPPLESGKLYHHQIIGLEVFEGETFLGEITEILTTGANDVYVVMKDGRELLLPAIPSVVLHVDTEIGTMQVHLLEGLAG
ncbi:MAG: ribosome maturation factor RimM [Anaerolineaceae bacterium]|jgi:16S rRNA processing protein RimM